MRWSGATGAIARCKSTSTGCARTSRSVPVLLWTCGEKPKPKAVNKPSHGSIMHGLDKPGVCTTVSFPPLFSPQNFQHFPPHGILELHLRVIWCNTCSSIIVSTNYPKNVQLTTDESKRFFKDE